MLSEETVFVYSSGKLIAEYSNEVSQTPTVAYTTTDHLGSPRIITDQYGQVKSRRDFMPFGEDIFENVGTRTASLSYSTSQDDLRQKFTGYQKDSETQLDFAEARMYENRFGRFTAVDPLLASGKSANPQTFNRYVYVGNNPVRITDPLGLDWYFNSELNRYDWSDDGKTFFYGKGEVTDGWEKVQGSYLYPIANSNSFISLDRFSHNYETLSQATVVAGIANGATMMRISGATKHTLGVGPLVDLLSVPTQSVSDLIAHPEVQAFLNDPGVRSITFALGVLGAEAQMANGFRPASQVVPKTANVPTTTQRLQSIVSRAASEVDAAGDAAFTERQLAALARHPNLRPAFRGNRIDVRARRYMEEEPFLSHLESNNNRGPDFLDPNTGQWWDMTTSTQWQRHLNRYTPHFGQNGTLLQTR